MSNEPEGMERRQRIREQMKEFYGDPTVNSDQRRSQETGKAGVQPELDLDSEYFNVGLYTTGMLQRESLKGLVESDTELLRSIRNLDGKLQDLVYKNYSKFISATDTIREMKENVTEMDAKLQALSSNVENIDSVSRGISDKLQTHRRKIEEMVSANRMLRKVQFLVELPELMRVLLDRKEYTTCVKYWVAGDSVLTKHGHIPSIEQSRQECKGMATKLYSALDEVVRTTQLDDPEVMDSVRRSVEDMRLMRATSLFTSPEGPPAIFAPTVDSNGKPETFDDQILKALLASATSAFNASIKSIHRNIKISTEVPDFKALSLSEKTYRLQRLQLRDHLAQLKGACALFSVNCERVYDIVNRLEDGKDVAYRTVSVVQPVLVDVIQPVTTQLGDLVVATIRSIATDDETARKEPVALRDALITCASSLAQNLKSFTTTLTTLGENYLDNPHSQQSHIYANIVKDAVESIFQRMTVAFTAKASSPPLVVAGATHASQMQYALSVTILALAAGAMESICMSQLDVAAGGKSGGASADARSAATTPLISNPSSQLAMHSIGNLRKSMMDSSQALINRFIALVAQSSLGLLVAPPNTSPSDVGTFAYPAATAEPVGVSPRLADMFVEWKALHKLLKVWFPSDQRPSNVHFERAMNSTLNPRGAGTGVASGYGGGGSSRGGAGSANSAPSSAVHYQRSENHSLLSNVDRIFSGQSSVLVTHVVQDVNCNTIMECVLSYVLKGLVDAVRVRVFTESSFQQVQVDLTYLMVTLLGTKSRGGNRNSKSNADALKWFVWEDESMRVTAEELIHECCICTYEHTTTKMPLSSDVLDRLVSAAIDQQCRKEAAMSASPMGDASIDEPLPE